MKNVLFFAAAVLLLAGCASEQLPESCVVVEKVAAQPDNRVVIDKAMAVRYFPVPQTIICGLLTSGSEDFREVRKSEVIPEETEQERDWKMYFSKLCDVTWPVGSSIAYAPGIGKLRVRNTEENLGRIAEFMDKMNTAPALLEVQARFVKVEQKTLDVLGAELLPGKGADRRYDLADFEDVPAADFERKLVARRDLLGNEAPKVLTRSGEEAVIKTVSECIYPTDFEVLTETAPAGSNATGRATGIAAVEPQSFMMREVGTILVVTPIVEDDGSLVDVRLNAQIVDKPEWTDFGMELPSPNGGSYSLPMKQPFFPVRSIDTNLSVVPGETVLAGARVSAERADVSELVFLRVRKLDTRGRPEAK